MFWDLSQALSNESIVNLGSGPLSTAPSTSHFFADISKLCFGKENIFILTPSEQAKNSKCKVQT